MLSSRFLSTWCVWFVGARGVGARGNSLTPTWPIWAQNGLFEPKCGLIWPRGGLISTRGVGGHEWVARQGFAIEGYMGGRDAVKRSLEEAPTGAAGMLPTKEKLTHRYTVDPAGVLFRSGAHKPLLVYVGSLSRRSPEALNCRESGINARAWGPDSWIRERLMQAQGRGPSPRKGPGQGR